MFTNTVRIGAESTHPTSGLPLIDSVLRLLDPNECAIVRYLGFPDNAYVINFDNPQHFDEDSFPGCLHLITIL